MTTPTKLASSDMILPSGSIYQTRYFHNDQKEQLVNFLNGLPIGTCVDLSTCKFGPEVAGIICNNYVGRLNFINTSDSAYDKSLRANNEVLQLQSQYQFAWLCTNFVTYDDFVEYLVNLDNYSMGNNIVYCIDSPLNSLNTCKEAAMIAMILTHCNYINLYLTAPQLYHISNYFINMGFYLDDSDRFNDFILFRNGNLYYFEEVELDENGEFESQYEYKKNISFYKSDSDYILIPKDLFNEGFPRRLDGYKSFEGVVENISEALSKIFELEKQNRRNFFEVFNLEV